MTTIIYILGVAAAAYLGWGVLYQFFYALAGRFWTPPRWPAAARPRKMLVLIPAYREDAVIVNTARVALTQDYPGDDYEVVVIADSLRADTVAALRALPDDLHCSVACICSQEV